MSAFEAELRDCFERLVAEPLEADWEDVLARTATFGREQPSSRRRRPLLLAAGVALLAAVVLAASAPARSLVTDGLDRFRAWLSGSPGEPAPPSERAALEQESARRAVRFPDGVDLRLLGRTRVAGATYELYGFRSGESLCLRLRLLAETELPPPSACAAPAALAAGAGVVVLVANHLLRVAPLPAGASSPRVTFGFAASDVRSLAAERPDGLSPVVLLTEANAFFLVDDAPWPAGRVRALVATTASGAEARVPIAALGADPPPAALDRPAPAGPETVERALTGGTIGWLERGEPRGEPLGPGFEREALADSGEVLFARVLRPDPATDLRVIAARVRDEAGAEQLCFLLTRPLGNLYASCGLAELFASTPVDTTVALDRDDEEQSTLAGLTVDGVASLALYTSAGSAEWVALADNAFAVQVLRGAFPVRVVGYDPAGLVVFTRVFEDVIGGEEPGEHPAGSWRALLAAAGERGERATLSVAPGDAGGRCWRLELTSGVGGEGCLPRRGSAALAASLASNGLPGAGVFLFAAVPENARRVTLAVPVGGTLTLPVTDGFVLAPLPAASCRPAGAPLRVEVYGALGAKLGRVALAPRSCPDRPAATKEQPGD